MCAFVQEVRYHLRNSINKYIPRSSASATCCPSIFSGRQRKIPWSRVRNWSNFEHEKKHMQAGRLLREQQCFRSSRWFMRIRRSLRDPTISVPNATSTARDDSSRWYFQIPDSFQISDYRTLASPRSLLERAPVSVSSLAYCHGYSCEGPRDKLIYLLWFRTPFLYNIFVYSGEVLARMEVFVLVATFVQNCHFTKAGKVNQQ